MSATQTWLFLVPTLMKSWIPRIKLNTIYTKLLAKYLMLTALGTSLMAGLYPVVVL